MIAFEIARLKWQRGILPKNDHDIRGVIHKRALITAHAYASSVFDDSYATHDPNYTINPSSKRWWTSKNTPHQYLIINFTQKLWITNYSVQSIEIDENNHHARQWDFFGIRSNGEEVLLDTVTNSKINGSLLVETRPIIKNEDYFTGFKILNTGNDYGGKNYLRFFKVDFFGIVEVSKMYCTRAFIKSKRGNNLPLIAVLLS